VTRSVGDKGIIMGRPAAMWLVPLAVLLTWSSTPATTICVPDNQPTIQAGIGAASAGDTVLVACGTYYEHDIVMKSGVYLTSETGLADCVTIDAQSLGRGIDCTGVDSAASIVGFTVTGGFAEGYDYPEGFGGGIFCASDSDPAFLNCSFSGNRAQGPGVGAYCGTQSSPAFTNCTFSGNGDLDSDSGGGLYCGGPGCSPTLVGCVFSENAADGGGGVYCDESASPTLIDCRFEGNNAGWGGGIYCGFYSYPVIEGCTFSGNSSFRGGGIACCTSSLTLTSCTFVANAGGGFYVGGEVTAVALTNTIIAFGISGPGVRCDWPTAVATLACCDIYGNTGGDWVGCIAGQSGLDGNLARDPLFCDIAEGDYTLCANSPCLPDSNDCGSLIGAHGQGCPDCGSPVSRLSWGSIKAIFR